MNVRIRNHHLDGYGHVNNTCCLEFLEEAHWTFFEQHDLLSALKGIILAVTCTDVRYRRPVVEGDELRFEDRLKGMTPRHIVLTQTIILPNGKNVIGAEITMMVINAASERGTSIPAPLSAALKTIATK